MQIHHKKLMACFLAATALITGCASAEQTNEAQSGYVNVASRIGEFAKAMLQSNVNDVKTKASIPSSDYVMYKGHYFCPQGKTALTLKINLAQKSPEAIFEFNTDEHINGSFNMRGSFDEENKEIKLYGKEWIVRPPDFMVVDLKGTFSNDLSKLSGIIQTDGCSGFEVSRNGTVDKVVNDDNGKSSQDADSSTNKRNFLDDYKLTISNNGENNFKQPRLANENDIILSSNGPGLVEIYFKSINNKDLSCTIDNIVPTRRSSSNPFEDNKIKAAHENKKIQWHEKIRRLTSSSHESEIKLSGLALLKGYNFQKNEISSNQWNICGITRFGRFDPKIGLKPDDTKLECLKEVYFSLEDQLKEELHKFASLNNLDGMVTVTEVLSSLKPINHLKININTKHDIRISEKDAENLFNIGYGQPQKYKHISFANAGYSQDVNSKISLLPITITLSKPNIEVTCDNISTIVRLYYDAKNISFIDPGNANGAPLVSIDFFAH